MEDLFAVKESKTKGMPTLLKILEKPFSFQQHKWRFDILIQSEIST